MKWSLTPMGPMIALGWLLLGPTGCGGTDPVPGPGTIRLIAVTTGEDPDPDGYAFSLDGNPSSALENHATVTITGLAAGDHEVTVTGIANNCSLAGPNPRPIEVLADDTVEVRLAVACQPLPIAHPEGVIARTVTLAGEPYGVAVSSQGVVYAALIGTSTLIRGDVADMTFGPTVQVGSTPPHVAFNPGGTTVYATLQTGRALAVVDVVSNTLAGTLPLGSDGFNLAVRPDGQVVYATTADGTLHVVDAATLGVDTTLQVGAAANGLAFSPDGKVLYVSARDAGSVTAIDVQTREINRIYSVGGRPQRLAVSPDGSELYVANEEQGLDVVNVVSGDVTSIGFQTAGYGLGLTPDGTQIYVLLPDAGEVRILDRATRVPAKTLAVGGRPRNVVFTEDGRTALVATEAAVVFIK
jgi:YVTN family beta-propeller protein